LLSSLGCPADHEPGSGIHQAPFERPDPHAKPISGQIDEVEEVFTIDVSDRGRVLTLLDASANTWDRVP
jgi:hypothetical protein